MEDNDKNKVPTFNDDRMLFEAAFALYNDLF